MCMEMFVHSLLYVGPNWIYLILSAVSNQTPLRHSQGMQEPFLTAAAVHSINCASYPKIVKGGLEHPRVI